MDGVYTTTTWGASEGQCDTAWTQTRNTQTADHTDLDSELRALA